MVDSPFSPHHLACLRQRNITEDEGKRQLTQLRRGRAFLPLVRPCTPGDGIRIVSPEHRHELQREFASTTGRWTRFVPASGAASRMFQGLFPDEPDPAKIALFREHLRSFPFYHDLKSRAGQPPEDLDDTALLTLLLGADGLALDNLPKGLLPLHRSGDYDRTAFAEHLHEGVALGIRRFHFTVSPEHRDLFQQQLELLRPRLEQSGDAIEVTFSVQSPQTDTVALDVDTQAPFHDEAGSLLFRPAGHGSLLSNLERCGGDLVLIRNIDNVVPEQRQPGYRDWTAILGGTLVALRREVFAWLDRLDRSADGETVARAARFLQETFGRAPGDGTVPGDTPAERLRFLLDRPIRVCGMVPVSGEPGGGPFWTPDALGQVSPQIIEGVQIDPDDAQQQDILKASTHFNPVNIACSLRDRDGRPYRLGEYVDEEAALITAKSHAGRSLLALERPGLWNGSMSNWNTLFIEIPAETFNPVKTVFDLLKPAHQVG